jgi:hypothetical protein
MNKVFYRSPKLKKISSVLLLFIFMLGVTPKKTLHDFFANHTDTTSSTHRGKTTELSKAGFNCKCDDLVAESHFVAFSSPAVVNLPPVHSFVSFSISPLVSLSLFHNNLRGPPLKF